MAGQVEIANRAITKLGGSRITSMADDVKAAGTMSSLWETCLKAELSKRHWNFALARTSLPSVSPAPTDGQFGAKFQLPVDFLRPVMVGQFYVAGSMADYRDSDDSPYAIEGSEILTDLGDPLFLRYVRYVSDPGAFHPLFVEVLAAKLAYEGCYDITQSRQGQEVAMTDYKEAVRQAALANAIAKPPQGIPDDSWMLGRL